MDLTVPAPQGCPLTAYEFAVVIGLANGLSYQQIADSTGRSVSTIRSQAHTAYVRLGVAGAIQAVVVCVREGWVWFNGREVIAGQPGPETGPLTPNQQVYIAAFELHKLSRTADERAMTNRIMDRALQPLAADAGLDVRGRGRRDLIEALIRDLRRPRRQS